MSKKQDWKPVIGFTDYEISSIGQVRSHKYGKTRIMVPRLVANGYFQVKFSTKSKAISMYIHRLVGYAFVPNPKGNPDINHKDGNKLNNIASNLEWVTKNENIQHAIAMGLYAKPVLCVELGMIFASQSEAGHVLGVKQSSISKVINGMRTKTGGLTFRRVL